MRRMLYWVAALICSVVTVHGLSCDYGKNIAEGKTAYQSSTVVGATPGRAVDGKMMPDFWQGSCTHTRRQNKPSWWVDLGKQYFVKTVILQNRGDCCSTRLKNVFISVGNDKNGGDMPICAHFAPALTAGEVKEMTCKTPMKGRYVKVHTGAVDFLTLCEVLVYGHPAE